MKKIILSLVIVGVISTQNAMADLTKKCNDVWNPVIESAEAAIAELEQIEVDDIFMSAAREALRSAKLGRDQCYLDGIKKSKEYVGWVKINADLSAIWGVINTSK